jgi:hypothetical protein
VLVGLSFGIGVDASFDVFLFLELLGLLLPEFLVLLLLGLRLIHFKNNYLVIF